MMDPIVGRRLLLREFQVEDEEVLHRIKSDDRVVRYLTWGPYTPAETHLSLKRQMAFQKENPRRVFALAAEEHEKKQLVGSGILSLVDQGQTGEIGYYMDFSYWNRGYGFEMAEALMVLAFERLELHRVIALCDVENISSWKILEKLGLKREGHMRESVYVRKQWRDQYLYAILADEWQRGNGT